MPTQNPSVILHGLPPAGSAVRQNFETWNKITKHTSQPFRGDSQEAQTRKVTTHCGPVLTSGGSVNDGISMVWSSVSYVSIDHLLALVIMMGKGALLLN